MFALNPQALIVQYIRALASRIGLTKNNIFDKLPSKGTVLAGLESFGKKDIFIW